MILTYSPEICQGSRDEQISSMGLILGVYYFTLEQFICFNFYY